MALNSRNYDDMMGERQNVGKINREENFRE